MRLAAAPCVLLLLLALSPLCAQGTRPINEALPTGWSAPTSGPYTMGYRFNTTAANVTIIEMGCCQHDALGKAMWLWDTTTPAAPIATITTAPAASGVWRWGNLTSPITLVPNRDYVVTVDATTYYFTPKSTVPAVFKPTGTINYVDNIFATTQMTFPNQTNTNYFGPVDIGYTQGPGLTVTATPGTAQMVFAGDLGPGGNGLNVGTFEIGSNTSGPVTMTDIELAASGTGDDSAAFAEVAIYRDSDNSSTFDIAQDALAVTTVTPFAVDDGSIVFSMVTAEQAFPASTSRRFFVVVKLAATALPNETFDFAIQDITVVSGTKGGVPSATMYGLVIDTPQFLVADNSSQSVTTVYLGSSDNVCQEFTIAYSAGPDDKPSNLSVTSLGTADESTDLVNVQLWWDSDSSGSFSSGADTLVDSQTFTQDNGVADFDLSAHPDFQGGQTRRYFVIYNLNTNAADLQTFQCYVSAVSGASLGGVGAGLPSPSQNGTFGLEVSANVLIATLNGPTAAATVNSDWAGQTGDGELLCDVTLAAAPGGAWDVSSVTFAAAGTGVHDTAYLEVALYEDDGNGAWDGAAIDTLAAPAATGFTTGLVTYALTTTAFPAATSRRFFLTGKLNGTATSGQTFNARIESVVTTPPAGGTVTGVPSADSTAMIIDSAALTVGNAPTQPTATVHNGGTAASYTIAKFLLTALNDSATVNSVALTTGGTGDWTSDVDAATGVQVYEDDGDGVFGAGSDTLLYQGAGAAVVTATFTAPLIMPVTSTATLWVRVGFTATAGIGAAATPETFTLSIAATTDVGASSTVLLGTPLPNGLTIGAIEFAVTSFSPTADLPKGGKAITIQGSGFMTPFVVKIGGVVCPGSPAISGGTQVTGIFVPPGGGNKLPIEINSGNLPAQVINNTFTYSTVGSTNNDGSGSGCAGTGSGWATLVALVGLIGLALIRRRRLA